MRSSTWDLSCLARKQGGVHVPRRSHDAIPICHFADFIHTTCCWEVASCAKTVGANPVTRRSKISVICNVHSGTRSTEALAHRLLLFIPRSRERTVERHLDVPVLQLHVSSATSSKSLQFVGRGQEQPGTRTQHRTPLFSFVRELIEVILLQPRQAHRWIAPGNRDSRCATACSAASGGALLQRVSSSTHERYR